MHGPSITALNLCTNDQLHSVSANLEGLLTPWHFILKRLESAEILQRKINV